MPFEKGHRSVLTFLIDFLPSLVFSEMIFPDSALRI